MGLRSDIQTEIAAAFNNADELADAVKVLTLIDRKSGVYDPATGVLTPSETTTATRGTVSPFTSLEVLYSGGTIDTNDSKVLILANEVSITPSTDHFLEIAGEEYRVLRVKMDPADVAWVLHTRKS